MKPISADHFLQATAMISMVDDEVREMSNRSEEHLMFLGAFSSCLTSQLFNTYPDINEERTFTIEDFDYAWKAGYTKAKEFVRDFGYDLPEKNERVEMIGKYIRSILVFLNHYYDLSISKYEEDEEDA